MKALRWILIALGVFAAIVIAIIVFYGASYVPHHQMKETQQRHFLPPSQQVIGILLKVLHPEISAQVDQGNFDVLFEAPPFSEDYSFNSYDYENGIWRFEGTASTASGCASEFIYASLNGKVIEFNVIPICPKP